MNKRKPLGFETPSMRMQEEYKEILEQIMAKKVNREHLLKHCNDMLTGALKGAEDIGENTESNRTRHEYLMELEHRVLLAALCLPQVMIARVGKELAECDIRISEIEKGLKELRRGLR